MPLDKGFGPLPPHKGIQPIRGLESGAPSGLRPVAAPLMPVAQGMMMGQPQANQAPDELALAQMRAMPSNPKDIPSAPFEKPIFDTPKTFAGWLQNLQDDVSTFIEGIPAMVKQAWQSGSYIAKNADWIGELYKRPELLTKELAELKTAVIKGMTDTYKDGFGEALYKHPFTVLLDATTVFDIIGGGLKMGGRAAMTAAEKQAVNAAAKLNQVAKLPPSVATKLMALGDNIQRAPGRIFAAPFKGLGNLAMKVPSIKRAAESLALTPYGLERKNLQMAMLLDDRVKAAQQAEVLMKSKLPKAKWDEYEALRMGYKALEDASDPDLARQVTAWGEANKFYENWMLEMGAKSADELQAAALKPLAQRLFEEGIFQGELGKHTKAGFQYNKEALDFAKAWTEGANPSGKRTDFKYSPYIKDREYGLGEYLDDLKSNANNLQYVGRWEKKGLKSEGLIENPRQAEFTSLLKIAELRGNVRFITDTLVNKSVLFKGPKPPPGMVVMDPILKPYIEKGLIPAYETMLAKKMDLMAKGLSEYDAVKGAAKAVEAELGELSLAAAKEAADNPSAFNIAIPREDAYLIQASLGGVSGPLAFYDKVMNTWRSTVLRLMPRYYMNNLLGNAILLTAGGHFPGMGSVSSKVMPAEALSSHGLLSETGVQSDFLRGRPGMEAVYKATDKLAEMTDSKPRGLLTNTKAREILKADAAMNDTVAVGLLAKGTMEDAVNAIADARKRSFDIPMEQAIQAKKINLLSQEQKRVESIDARMQNIQQQIDMEKRLSNATPEVLDMDKAALEQRITDLIARNGPADEIHNLQERLRKTQKAPGVAGDNEHRMTRIQELNEQLKAAAAEREAIAGAYPYTRSAGGIGEETEKLLALSREKEALAPLAQKMERAIVEMERFLGAYGRAHPLEREWIRRVIPFWQFVKTMNVLVATMPFVMPKRAFLWNQYAKLMLDGANDDRLPYRYRNHLPIGSTKDGQLILMRHSGWNPFDAVKAAEFGGMTIPKLIDPANNPFVKMVIESRGGYDTFTEKPFSEITDFTSLDGTVWRFDPKTGILEPTIPQKGLVGALLNQIPHVRIVQELMDSYPGTREAAGISRKDPEGRYYYDRSAMWAASRAMGFPITVGDPNKIKMQHELLVRGMIKRFQAAGRRVDPETQAKLQHIINDLANGAFELREWD